MLSWWERWPGWYDYEMERLALLPQVRLTSETKEAGRLILDLEYQHNNKTIQLQVICGAFYPSFPPSIRTPGRKQARHRGGTTEHLCMLAHDSNGGFGWVKFQDTIAGMIERQVPQALEMSDKARDGTLDAEHLADKEMAVGEPLTAFLFAGAEGGLLVDEFAIPDSETRGELHWWLSGVLRSASGEYIVRGGVLRVLGREKRVLAETDSVYVKPTLSAATFTSSWFREELPDTVNNKDDLWKWFGTKHPLKLEKMRKQAQTNNVAMTAVLLQEEVQHLARGDSWIFFLVANVQGQERKIVIRGIRASQSEIQLRVPELNGLPKKRVMLIGLGSIGSPIAIQLARAGIGEITLIDKDVVEPGNTVRWALGMSAVGLLKANVLHTFILQNYPKTKSIPIPLHVGAPEEMLAGAEKLESMMKEMDLVIDATANIEVNECLSAICLDNDTPYEWLSATEGAYGGIIGRVVPALRHGCWNEYMRRLNDGEIELPRLKEGDSIVPKGCVDPTFTGAGIDCEQIGLFAARLAISTLSRGSAKSYPDFGWNVGVVNFRNETGDASISPSWETYSFECSDDCIYCGGRNE